MMTACRMTSYNISCYKKTKTCRKTSFKCIVIDVYSLGYVLISDCIGKLVEKSINTAATMQSYRSWTRSKSLSYQLDLPK